MNTQQQNYHRSDLHPLPMRVSRLQIERLRDLRAKDGLSVQEHVRRSIDQYLAILDQAPNAPRAALETSQEWQARVMAEVAPGASVASPQLPKTPANHPTGADIAHALRSPPIKPKRIRVRQR
jgi:hypothetical protein